MRSFASVIVLLNAISSSFLSPAAKPRATPVRKTPIATPKASQRAPRASHVETHSDEETDSDGGDVENNRGIVMGNASTSKRAREQSTTSGSKAASQVATPSPKKRQPRKSTAAAATTAKVPVRSTLRSNSHQQQPTTAATAVVVRETLLADWDDVSDTDTAAQPHKEKGALPSRDGTASESHTAERTWANASQNSAQRRDSGPVLQVASDGTEQCQTIPDSGYGDVTGTAQQQQQQQAIRNIPKKDRRGIILDKFFPNGHEVDTKWSQDEIQHGESEPKPMESSPENEDDAQENDPSAVIVLDSEDSDNELLRHTDDNKAPSDDENFDRRSNSSDDQVEEVIEDIVVPSAANETVIDPVTAVKVVETEAIGDAVTIDRQSDGSSHKTCESDKIKSKVEQDVVENIPEATVTSGEQGGKAVDELEGDGDDYEEVRTEVERAKEENDLLLLQQSADLLHETTSLLNTAAAVATTTTKTSIEPIGVIGKKRRLQRKHRRTNESESVDESVDDEMKASAQKVQTEAGDAVDTRLKQQDSSNLHTEDLNKAAEICQKIGSPETIDSENRSKKGKNEEGNDEQSTGEEFHESRVVDEIVNERIPHEVHTAMDSSVEKTVENKENETTNGIEEDEDSALVGTPSDEIKDTETIHENDKLTMKIGKVVRTEHNEIEIQKSGHKESEEVENVEEATITSGVELARHQSETENSAENVAIEKSIDDVSKTKSEPAKGTEAIPPKEAAPLNESVESDENNRYENENTETGSSPTATVLAPPSKTDVDCFDFKDEEEEFVPKSLNRRKRRCLPPGKRFELETMDKLEEIRKIEEEKAKRLKLEKEKDKDRLSKSEPIIENIVAKQGFDTDESAMDKHSSPEKNTVDEHLKDGRSLPPKERGKRIFKSRNRSRQSEGDSFSNEEKTPAPKESSAHPWDERESDTSPSKNTSESSSSSMVLARSVPLPVEVENVAEKGERRLTFDAEAIVSEVVDTLINLPMSSDLSGESTIKIGLKRPSLSDVNDQSSPSKLMKPIKMTFALNSSSDSVCIVKTDDAISSHVMDAEMTMISKKSKHNDGDMDDVPSSKKQKSSYHHASDEERGNRSDDASRVLSTSTNQVLVSASDHQSPNLFVDAATPNSVVLPSPATPTKLTKPPKPPTEPKKRGGQRKSNATGKVLMKIGYDTQGNPITVLRKPPTSPVVHLPSHIQTPDLAVPPSASNTPTFTTKGSSNTQIVITSKGTLLTTNATTNSSQMTSTVSVSNSGKTARSSASVAYSTPSKLPAKIQVQSQKIICHGETASSRASSLLAAQSQTGLSQQQMLVDDLQKRGYIIKESSQSQKIQATKPKTAGKSLVPVPVPTAIVTSDVVVAQKPTKSSRLTKKQQLQQQQLQMQQEMTRRQQEAAARQQEAEKAAEITQNIQDNQLLAIPADNFDGPPGSFYLCTAENNTYFPIDRQPLYLDDKNQLVPMPGATGPMNVAMNEDIVDDSAAQVTVGSTQESEYASSANVSVATTVAVAQEQITTNLPNMEDPSNLTYLINTGDGQQILLDQQSMLQLTAGGEMPQLITADGQQLILHASPQDILASISSSNPHHPEMGLVGNGQQIIIPENMTVIEEDGNANHDILAAALADTEVFQQEHYISDGIDANVTVDQPAFQTINQAATSETNAILPPIMSTLEQPSSKTVDGASPSVDCANLDESLAVIGVSAPSNVPTSLELPITVTNPTISSAAAAAPPTAYDLFDASTLPISSETVAVAKNPIVDSITEDGDESIFVAETHEIRDNDGGDDDNDDDDEADAHDITTMDIDSNSEIIPNTPDSVTNQARIPPELTGFTSDNSNSCEIPLQSNLILRTPPPDTFNHSSPPLQPLGGDRIHLQNSHSLHHQPAEESVVISNNANHQQESPSRSHDGHDLDDNVDDDEVDEDYNR